MGDRTNLRYALLSFFFYQSLYCPGGRRQQRRAVLTLSFPAPISHSTQNGLMVITGRAVLEGAFLRYQVDFSTDGLGLVGTD